MDRVRGKLPNTCSRLIAMAATMVGAAEKVRDAMGASPVNFELYRAGTKEPSITELGRLIDLIVLYQGEQIRTNRELIAKMRALRSERDS